MRFFEASIIFLLMTTGLSLANPTEHPEDAIVFIEIFVETYVPAEDRDVRTKVGEGSGFLIHEDGWVVTARHVVDVERSANSKVIIEGAIGSRFHSRLPLEWTAPGLVASDVALLRFPAALGGRFPYLCSRRYPVFRLGQSVSVWGFPLGRDIALRPGTVTSQDGENGTIQTNVGLAPGMSGGPVLDTTLTVVGVARGRLAEPNFDYFTPVNLALPLFNTPAPPNYVGENCTLPEQGLAGSEPLELVERSFEISETLEEHTSLTSTTTRSYAVTKVADPGFEIDNARFVSSSETRVGSRSIRISEDRKSATMEFTLTSGPIVDQYRGWLTGQLVLTLRPERN